MPGTSNQAVENPSYLNGTLDVQKKLWEHSAPIATAMWAFKEKLNAKYKLQLKKYGDLHAWSINNIDCFWGEIWDVTSIVASTPYKRVIDEAAPMFPRPKFFDGAQLNFAENLLFPPVKVDKDSPAIIAATETTRESVSWMQLREQVRKFQSSLISLRLKQGDRVAGYLGNHTNAVVAMLAATSLGAIWTAVSPDTGVHGVLERWSQIDPVLLLVDNASFYNGRSHPVLPKAAEIAVGLPSLSAVVVFPTIPSVEVDLSLFTTRSGEIYDFTSFIALGSPSHNLIFKPLPADHALYILYSSGTTGKPKCIVHGSIGTLIQHKKEHILHCGIGPGKRFFYFTTVSWMMWHWLVSGLASGATLILYDGSPFRSPDPSNPASSIVDDVAMPRLIEELKITHFGTSAKYLSVLEQKGVEPKVNFDLSPLEAIYSTGSPLAPSTFSYVYAAFPSSINLGSITGGTDIVSLFGAPSPLNPVYVGEIQVPSLGMAIQAWDYAGNNISATGEAGDLVCVKPFPCQPVTFWGQDGESKYRSSYFEKFEGVWHHGDFVRFNPATGGLVMLGRSDGILKPAGVRFGSAEIYNVILEHFSEDVEDALCIGRRREIDTDETVVLFLKMSPGKTFTETLVNGIKTAIKKELSPRHVPGIVDECPEIPVTSNGKKIEGAVKQILCGLDIKTSASVANAECLTFYRTWAKQH